MVKTEAEHQFHCVSNFRGQLFVGNSPTVIPKMNHVSNNFTKSHLLVRSVIILKKKIISAHYIRGIKYEKRVFEILILPRFVNG